ncbi:MAG: NAD(P)/FAD-dependent oxidoreductase [Firmicutes bacterium]|nr:NAD(P)/FAD-dependent oxidoreductase [Bacillota bacterium]
MNHKTYHKAVEKIHDYFPTVNVSLKDDCIVLEGELEKWDEIVEAGFLAVEAESYGVINKITLKGYVAPPVKISSITDQAYDGLECDVLIIGGGVVGTAILREFSKYQVNAVLVEKEADVALHASGRNDGCIHVGVDLSSKSLKHHYLREAVKDYKQLAEDLGVDYKQTGQTLAFTKKYARLVMPLFLNVAKKRGLTGTRVMNKAELRQMEPNITEDAEFAVFFPEGATICPYNMTIALAENAIENGGRVLLNTAVTGMSVKDHHVTSVQTNHGTLYPKVVVNAAGTYSDVIAAMADDQFFTIHPRKGIELILDQKAKAHSVNTSLSIYHGSDDRKAHTKGGGLIPTVDGNILVGPTAAEVPDRENFVTDLDSVNALLAKHKLTTPSLSFGDVITYFTGIRAATYEEDFIVQKGKWTDNIVHAAGIQSPGLTAAPAIAVDIVKFAEEELKTKFKVNTTFNPKRKVTEPLKRLSFEARDALIKTNPDYGQVICRCEEVSKGEILDALRRPLPVNR